MSSTLFRRFSPVLAWSAAPARSLHSTTRLGVKLNDKIPDGIELMEDSPGNKISIANELKGKKALLIGVPAAFSPACSATHIPGYIAARSGLPTYVISVNDPFVMKAWGESLSGSKEAGIRFLADSAGQLTETLDLAFDGKAIFGGLRSKRYALYVEDGHVKKMFVEPDNTGVDVSRAENVLKRL